MSPPALTTEDKPAAETAAAAATTSSPASKKLKARPNQCMPHVMCLCVRVVQRMPTSHGERNHQPPPSIHPPPVRAGGRRRDERRGRGHHAGGGRQGQHGGRPAVRVRACVRASPRPVIHPNPTRSTHTHTVEAPRRPTHIHQPTRFEAHDAPPRPTRSILPHDDAARYVTACNPDMPPIPALAHPPQLHEEGES